MSQAPNRYGGFSKCQAGTPTQKQKFNEQPLGALSLLRTVVPESLRHAGPKGLARARLLESVVGKTEQETQPEERGPGVARARHTVGALKCSFSSQENEDWRKRRGERKLQQRKWKL